MANPLPKVPHDLGVVDIAPANQTDPRVPMAEQFALAAEIGIGLFRRANAQIGWHHPPSISITSPRQINLEGSAVLPGYPKDLVINTAIVAPALPSPTAVVRQEQYLSLVAVTVDVGAEHDATLNVSFQYRNPTNTSQILNTSKENARRWRAYWLLVLSPDALTKQDFVNVLTLVGGDRRLTIGDATSVGFVVPGMQFYARDSAWIPNKTYTIHPDYIDIAPVCIVRRMQKYQDRGYTFGYSGEEPLTLPYNIVRTYQLAQKPDLDSLIRERLVFELFAGKPGPYTAYLRTVQNLTSGQVARNDGLAGEAAGSPDGSVCLANDQRSGFSNEARVRKWSVNVVVAGNDGTGRAVVAVALNTNSPIGTRFSENPTDHKIYAANGTEQSGFGNFTSLGSNAALTWVGTAGNPAIAPGSTVYVVAGVTVPAGSGFSIPFAEVEKVWRNTELISAANVRVACDDIGAYEDPVEDGLFIVVLGRERQALHYIYKKVVIASSSSGVAVIPANERGLIAFIQGVSGRIDAPVKAGLAPNANYNALVYYPPRSLESWQFQFRYPEYQGTSLIEPDWLTGATIISSPILYAHTQGAGGSVFQGSEPLRFSPIASHLPATVSNPIPPYRLNTPIRLPGEASLGPGAVFREFPRSLLLSASGLALPIPGQKLTLQTGAISQGRSLKGQLLADGQLMGFRSPSLTDSDPYQLVVSFAVKKGDTTRLVVVTRTTRGAEDISINSDLGTAFDVFRI